METKLCRFCGESHIPIYDDICMSCETILNTNTRKRPPNPYDSTEPIDDTDECDTEE